MSIENGLIASLLVIGTAFLWAGGAIAQESEDPVLQHYVDRARTVFESRDPLTTGVSFSITATNHLNLLGKRGQVSKTDTAVTTFYYSFGNLDSTHAVVRHSGRSFRWDFAAPNVFNYGYQFSFFPNDTGGADLAIGFDATDSTDVSPTGIAVIDRDRHFLKSLYLYYPDRKNFKRYSSMTTFTEHEGYIFPDSMEINLAQMALFSTDYYRLNISFSDIHIYR